METEAKFIVEDEDKFTRLQAVDRFGPYTRQAVKTKAVHDRYLDTADRNFYRRNFYARLREGKGDGDMLLTMKSVGGSLEGAVHTREEYETEVSGLDVSAWPESAVRRMVQEIAGDQSLNDLFALDQTRTVSILQDHDRHVAEMSLDVVIIEGPDEPMRSYELEIELLPDGTIADLAMLSRLLIDDYGLIPQTLSKFERAIRLLVPGGVVQNVAPVALSSEEVQWEPADLISTTVSVGPPPEQPSGKKRTAGVKATDSIAKATRKLMNVQFGAMLDNEAGTRAGEDMEALHDMRVATRRMRAAFRVLGPYLDSPSGNKVQKMYARSHGRLALYVTWTF